MGLCHLSIFSNNLLDTVTSKALLNLGIYSCSSALNDSDEVTLSQIQPQMMVFYKINYFVKNSTLWSAKVGINFNDHPAVVKHVACTVYCVVQYLQYTTVQCYITENYNKPHLAHAGFFFCICG